LKELIQSVFPIVGYEDLNEPFENIGTAFFIDKDGVFVTAAHTFKKGQNDLERNYYAIIDYKKVPIIPIFREREDMEKQVLPIHKDLYIGRLELGSENLYYSLDTADISVDTNLLTEGFARKKYVERSADDKPLISINDLYDDDSEEDDTTFEDDLIFDKEGELIIPETENAKLTYFFAEFKMNFGKVYLIYFDNTGFKTIMPFVQFC
jgi:hypothetical protein